ncbi:MAG: PEP-CTERM sorting domain-containing protein [Opitutaceae bacterium]|nr:PEP-CTERM sorting domain-containing protein [Opitutaceae bacterium]
MRWGASTISSTGWWTRFGLVLLPAVLAVGLRAQVVYTWNGGDLLSGSITPAGVSTVGALDTLNIVTTSDHNVAANTLTNLGTVNWLAGRVRGGGSIANNGIWNDEATSTINADYGAYSFLNGVGAVYNKTQGTTTFATSIVNAGTVNVTGGTLNFSAGGLFTDGSVAQSTGSGALQLTGGTLTMAGTVTLRNFTFAGGNLAGDHTLAATSTVTWQGGSWNSANTTAFAAGSTLTISGAGDHDYNGHTIVNNGAVLWTGGRLRSGNGGTITNQGTWTDAADGYAFNNDYGGVGGTTFVNSATGVYTKTAGVTTFQSGILNNYGLVDVTGGTLNLNGGALNAGSTIRSSGSGVVQLTAGTLTASGAVNVQNFLLNGGRLAGTHTFLGTLSWLNGDLNSTGTTTIGSGSTFTIAGASDHDYNGHAIVNQGTVVWTGGRLRSGNGGTITNQGTWTDAADGYAFNNDYGGVGGTTFVNSATGVYTKTAGVTTFLDGILVNYGLVDVTGGTLNLNGGALNAGSTIRSSGSGVVQLTAGTLTASGAVNVQNFLLNGGQLAGTHTFLGTLSWLNGDLNSTGTTTIGAGSTLTIAGTADHNFNGRAIVNDGAVVWTGGRLRSGSGGTITNQGTWTDAADGYAFNNDYGGIGGTTFVNSATGVYNKNGGTTSVLVPFNNAGVVNVNSGTLAFSGGFANTGTVAIAGGAILSSSGALTFGAGSLLRGGGTLNAPSLTTAGMVAPGTTATAGLLTLGGNLSLQSTSQALFEIGGTTLGTQHDHLAVTGTLTLDGALSVRFIDGFDTAANFGMTFEIINAATLLGSFSNIANGSRLLTADGFGTFVVNYGAGSPYGVNKVVLSNLEAIPEPSTWALLLTGGATLAYAARRRRARRDDRS